MPTFRIDLAPDEVAALRLGLQNAMDRFAASPQASPEVQAAWNKVADMTGDPAPAPGSPAPASSLALTGGEAEAVGAALHDGLSTASLIVRGAVSGAQGRVFLPRAFREMDRATADQWSQAAQRVLLKIETGLAAAGRAELAAQATTTMHAEAQADAKAAGRRSPWWRRLLGE